MANETIENIADIQGFEAIDALLDDLDLNEETVEDEPAVEMIGDDLEEIVLDEGELRDFELTTAREEAYEEQESEIEADAEAVVQAKKEQKAKGPKAARAPRAAGVPRTPRVNLASMDASNFVLEGDVSAMSDEDKEATKIATLALMPPQKKIAEKFENLFQQLANGKLPSVYVVQAFKLLDEKKTMSSSELVAAFKSRYGDGTSMSQAGQIMGLFDVLKIAKRTKNVLELNSESVVAERLRDAILAAK